MSPRCKDGQKLFLQIDKTNDRKRFEVKRKARGRIILHTCMRVRDKSLQ